MYRIGFGYDVHTLVHNRPLYLGGVLIPSEKGALGHSDADVLIHAICDALLGAANLRDIGFHFPPNDPQYHNIDSKILLQKVNFLLLEKQFVINNIDSTLVLEKPKINPFVPDMQSCLANVLQINTDQIAIKATTNEQMGFVGRSEGVAAYAVTLIQKCNYANLEYSENIELAKANILPKIENAIDEQEKIRVNLLLSEKNTIFGQQYNFKNIKNALDFSKNIPLQNYESIKDNIAKMRNGQRHIYSRQHITHFAKSSGTTNDKSKFIPVSSAALQKNHYQAGKDMLAVYCANYPENRLFQKKSLVIGGSSQVNEQADTCYGDLSALLVKNLPFWVNLFQTPSSDITLLPDWEKKLTYLALSTQNENIGSISGVPSWTMVLIQKILDLNRAKTIQEIWPNLEVFFHGGVSFLPYRQQFEQLIGNPNMRYVEVYNASEGFFAFQDQKDSADLLLLTHHGIYYELMPLSELNQDNPKVIPLSEAVLGQIYSLIISSNSGLWRYQLGDTISFTNLSPYRIKIAGRTQHFINAFGEELMIENAEKALSTVCEKLQIKIREFTAAPFYLQKNASGYHQWLIEFENIPENLTTFAQALDQTLQNLNSDYEAKRKGNFILQNLQITIARKNLFYDWLKQKEKLGGQHKVPRLANHRTYIEEILLLN